MVDLILITQTAVETLWMKGFPQDGCGARSSPCLGPIAVEDLVGPYQVQFPVALFKHVGPRQPAGRRHQSLLHGRWVDQLPVQHSAAGKRGLLVRCACACLMHPLRAAGLIPSRLTHFNMSRHAGL